VSESRRRDHGVAARRNDAGQTKSATGRRCAYYRCSETPLFASRDDKPGHRRGPMSLVDEGRWRARHGRAWLPEFGRPRVWMIRRGPLDRTHIFRFNGRFWSKTCSPTPVSLGTDSRWRTDHSRAYLRLPFGSGSRTRGGRARQSCRGDQPRTTDLRSIPPTRRVLVRASKENRRPGRDDESGSR